MSVAEFHRNVNNNKESRHKTGEGDVENKDTKVNVNDRQRGL